MERWLCSADPVQRAHAAYRLALGDREPEASPPMPTAEAVATLALIRRCPYRSTEGCGCSGARCGLTQRIVSHLDCLECAKRYGDS